MATVEPEPRAGHTGDEAQPKRRNPWMWVSVALAAVAVGLLVWGLNTRSDLNSSQQKVKDLEAELTRARTTGTTAAASYKTAYEDLQQDLGTTSADLAATEKDLKDAEKAAKTAEQQAAAAKQDAATATSATDKANAQAKQAQEEAKAAKSQTKVVTDCANAYLTAVGSVAQSDDPESAAAAAKKDLQGIAPDCKAALGE